MIFRSQVAINGLGDFISEVVSLRDFENESTAYFQWYRGHADIAWELIPKVQRSFNGNEEELFRRERYLTNDFQARACVLPTTNPKPKLNEYTSWLTLMQHYGLPTRLLDWSRSPLVALYFAVHEEIHFEKDACIWILTPGKLNSYENLEEPTRLKDNEYENSYIYNMAHNTITTMVYTAFRRWDLSDNPEAITPDDKKFDHRFNALRGKIAACYPTEADSRVYNQYSAFTVHNSLEKLVSKCDDAILKRLVIPNKSKERLLYELSVCGITQNYVFPDFENLARVIRKWYEPVRKIV